jgi:hypothetical protein
MFGSMATFAYLTDAGKPGIIVVKLTTGSMRECFGTYASGSLAFLSFESYPCGFLGNVVLFAG